MSAPDKRESWAMEEAASIVRAILGGYTDDEYDLVAQTLLAAEARGYQRGIEDAAKVADEFSKNELKWRDHYRLVERSEDLARQCNMDSMCAFNVAAEIRALAGVEAGK